MISMKAMAHLNLHRKMLSSHQLPIQLPRQQSRVPRQVPPVLVESRDLGLNDNHLPFRLQLQH
jgi:hypothetical protein